MQLAKQQIYHNKDFYLHFNMTDAEDQKKTEDEIYEDFKAQGAKRGLFDIYDLTSVVPHTGWGNYLQSWYRILVCIALQVLGPVWVIAYNIETLTRGGEGEGREWENLCDGVFSSETTFWDFATKFMSAMVTLYEIAKIHKILIRFQQKPTYQILVKNKRFAAMKVPGWAYVGLLTNYLCSILCLLACIALTYEANSATNVILRAVTIFFLIQADNELLDSIEVDGMVKKLDDEDNSKGSQNITHPFNIGSSLKILNAFCIAFLHVTFWAGPTYMFICKKGFE